MARHEKIVTQEFTYTIVLTPDEDEGGYVVTVPSLPGCITDGDTREEARAHAADAIAGYLEALRQSGEPLPASDPVKVTRHREPLTVKLPVA